MKILPNELPPKYWQDLAKKNGISRNCYQARLRLGHSPRKAATTPINKKHQQRLGKYVEGSARQAALAAGLPETAITHYRKRNKGTELTDQQIIKKLQAYHDRMKNPISKQAAQNGLTTATVYRRMSVMGWTLEKALSTPPASPSEAGKIGNKVRNQKRQKQREEKRALNNASAQRNDNTNTGTAHHVV
ncbi:hypothetical protein K1Y77_17135 (plasmid) [Halomonas qaidamensis]|uniref:Uncharacterized protein n=1 Tax=Halomonas qaidamensis TaxID=2866211 RepID=A0ABY6JXD7_9GAMM|nr:hypothetical protein [Halomonas qaidamensis]UYV20944.1 hypothetical protein K1Y77_17135 [Halomonas qaidamensis]